MTTEQNATEAAEFEAQLLHLFSETDRIGRAIWELFRQEVLTPEAFEKGITVADLEFITIGACAEALAQCRARLIEMKIVENDDSVESYFAERFKAALDMRLEITEMKKKAEEAKNEVAPET